MEPILIVCGVLIALRLAAQLALEWLNQKHVRAHAGAVPAAFVDTVTPETYAKSVEYTQAKGRFEMVTLVWDAFILAAILFSGVLPRAYALFQLSPTSSIWVAAAFLLSVALALSILNWPFEWYAQFRLEERFGFNTSTAGTWWADRVKGILLSIIIGGPLIAMILKLARWLGPEWWFWAWVCFALFQIVMMVLAPIVIMPLFNKFTPLAPGELRDQLLALGERAGFRAREIQVMDGSKRSRHSNAFFTGLGNFRKIVLFDTLIQQLGLDELESVLAHEIGHHKKGHIPKMIAMSLGASLPIFYLMAALTKQEWFVHPFGFQTGDLTATLLLISLLAGLVTFWFSPLAHLLSRRYEYEADAYAAELMKKYEPLVTALRKLNEKNLSNLTPHPFYSGFYYSHPTLLEREAALARSANQPAV